MEGLGEYFRRLLFLLRGDRFNREMEEEMRFHLEECAANNRNHGASPEIARLAAQRRFGNAAALRERSRDAWGWAWLDQRSVSTSLRQVAHEFSVEFLLSALAGWAG